MAKARPRVVANHKIFINGKSLEGVRFILLGPCSYSKTKKRPDGKPHYKKDLTHYLLRFESKKDPKQMKIPGDDFAIDQKHFPLFFEEAAV